jgi:hypothetical protein
MGKKHRGGMKSAYELAMERLAADAPEAGRALTSEQLKALALVDEDVEVRIAELDIMAQQRIAQARAEGDADAVRELGHARSREARQIREEGEERKARIRGEA